MDDGALATVIPLTAIGRLRRDRGGVPALPDDAVGRDGALLGRLYGDRWPELPPHLGRAAAGLERLLEQGPMAIDPADALPGAVLSNAWLAVRAANVHALVLEEEAEVLGEALGVPLAGLPLDQLGRVAAAVLAVGAAGGGDPSWAKSTNVDAARLVLDAHGADLREAAELHRQIYERFTDQVWDIRESRVRSGARRVSVLGRWLLRSKLHAVSRTEAVGGSVRAMAGLIMRARTARQRLVDLAPLLERHLGRQWRGPLTDIAPIIRSQDAIRQLHRALGEHLDDERLAELLVAEAFTSDDLADPARQLVLSLRAWDAELASLCTGDPWALPANELAHWASETGAALGHMAGVLVELGDQHGSAVPLRDVVDVLLLREHVEEEAGGRPPEHTDASSDDPTGASAPQSRNASSL